ncbi:MAG: ABC transporter permease, partial [Enhydrobacter sp.]
MLQYVIRRLLLMIPTLFVISFLVYFIIDLPPGDCVTSQIDELIARGEPDALKRAEELRHLYGLDHPLMHRYLTWVAGVFRWDFGLSCQDTVPVKDLIGERIALTMIMEAATIAFIWIVSFVIGVYAATHQYKLGDYVASFFGFIGLAVPNFLLALVLLYVGKVYFGLSIGGLMDAQYLEKSMSWDKAVSIMQHLIIPVIVIGTSGTAGMIRRLRANLLDELQKQYVVTGRAKGLSEFRLLVKYPLRHAINPFVSDIGHLIPEVISGSVIVSVV